MAAMDINGLMHKIDGLVTAMGRGSSDIVDAVNRVNREVDGVRQTVQTVVATSGVGGGGGAAGGIDEQKLFSKIDELIRGVNNGSNELRATQSEIGHAKDEWDKFLKSNPTKGQKRDKWKGLSSKDKNILLREGVIKPNDALFRNQPNNGGLSAADLKKTWRELGNAARRELLKGLNKSKTKAMWNETNDADRGALFDDFKQKDGSGKTYNESELTDEGKHERRRRQKEERDREKQRNKEAREFTADEVEAKTFGWKRAMRKAQTMDNAGQTMQMAGAAMKNVKGLGMFGKALGSAGKLLSRFAGPVGIALAALDVIGDVIGAWKKYSAEMMEFQRKDEQLQYEHQKKLAELTNESIVETIGYNADLNMRAMDVQTATALDAARLEAQFATQAVETRMGAMTKGINQSAYDAAAYAIDNAATYQKNLNAQQAREASQAQFERKRTAEHIASQGELVAQTAEENVNYRTAREMNQLLMHQAQNNSIGNSLQSIVRAGDNDTGGTGTNPVTGQSYDMQERAGVGNSALSLTRNLLMPGLTEGVQAVNRKELEFQQQREKFETKWNTTRMQLGNKEINARIAAETSLQEKRIQYEKEYRDIQIDTAKEIQKQYLKLAQTIEGVFDKVDAASNNLAMSLGITDRGGLSAFQKAYTELARDTFTKWGKTIEEGAALQRSYIESTGRNTNLSQNDYGQLFGLGHLVGSDQLAAQYGSNMELFNHSVEESVDMLDTALQKVTRMGLNGRKYTKDIVNNLRLASKLNFKGGTRGFMDMAAWAQKVRFNMGSLEGMVDKIKEGGLEGVIQQSAQFQVLGGNAAIYSDPLGMMYDSLNDVAALGQRYQNMLKGYGTYDKATGETRFNGNEEILLTQIAKVQGRSLEEVKQGIMDMNKRGDVEKVLNANEKFNEDQKTLITSAAHLVDGVWKVTMRDGTKQDVDKLTQADVESLMPKTHNDRMESYMQQVLESVKGIKGEELREQYDQVFRNFDTFVQQYAERVDVASAKYAEKAEEYASKIEEMSKLATQNYEALSAKAAQAEASFDEEIQKIRNGADDIASVLAETARRFQAAQNGVYEAAANPDRANRLQGANLNLSNMSKSQVAEVGLSMVDKHGKLIYSQNGEPVSTWTRNRGTVGGGVRDGVAYANGQPMLAAASNVKSIHDGSASLVSSDPADTALFAKDGGPFDTLFNGIFSKVSALYDMSTGANSSHVGGPAGSSYVSNAYGDVLNSLHVGGPAGSSYVSNAYGDVLNSSHVGGPAGSSYVSNAYGDVLNSSHVGGPVQAGFNEELFRRRIAETQGLGGFIGVTPTPISPDFSRGLSRAMPDHDEMDRRFMEFKEPMQRGNAFGSLDGGDNGGNSGGGMAGGTQTINVNLNGRLELSSGGQSVDVLNVIRQDPMLMRQLTEMIVRQMNNNANGGKNDMFPGRYVNNGV